MLQKLGSGSNPLGLLVRFRITPKEMKEKEEKDKDEETGEEKDEGIAGEKEERRRRSGVSALKVK